MNVVGGESKGARRVSFDSRHRHRGHRSVQLNSASRGLLWRKGEVEQINSRCLDLSTLLLQGWLQVKHGQLPRQNDLLSSSARTSLRDRQDLGSTMLNEARRGASSFQSCGSGVVNKWQRSNLLLHSLQQDVLHSIGSLPPHLSALHESALMRLLITWRMRLAARLVQAFAQSRSLSASFWCSAVHFFAHSCSFKGYITQ